MSDANRTDLPGAKDSAARQRRNHPSKNRVPIGDGSKFVDSNSGQFEEEPLSVAEEIAKEKQRGKKGDDTSGASSPQNDVHIAKLQKLSMAELIEEARKENMTEVAGMNKQQLIFNILKERVKMHGLMYGEGTLEILPDGFGFLRSPDYHYLSCPDDIYVSPSQIRRFNLKTGATVSGQIRPPKENERYFALLRVEAINFQDPNAASKRVGFDELTPLHPSQRIMMESEASLLRRATR